MEKYCLEGNTFTIEDSELDIKLHSPIDCPYLPENPYDKQEIGHGYWVKVVFGPKKKKKESYIVRSDGQWEGQYVSFYPSGAQKMVCFYQDGKLHGPSYFYAEEGQVLSQSWFVHGNRHGKMWWYYPNGELYSLQRFLDGKWHGKQEYYYSNGNIKTVMHYNHGKLAGEALLYEPDGRLKRTVVVVSSQ